MTLRGMTWSHPRATQPLAAFALARPDLPKVEWDSQPLAAFEAHPIDELARRYDLLVIDHPGIGAAVAAGALRPLNELFDTGQLAVWEAASVARTWYSYRYLDQQWALPIDAATQVSVIRADRAMTVPRRWEDVPAFAGEHPTTLCLAGPHAGLTLLAMASSAGALGAVVDPAFGVAALALLQSLWSQVDRGLSLEDPIAVHEAIAAPGGPVYCPLAYGYAAYSPAITWSDAPGWGSGLPGSVLGGTGLAVSALTDADPDEVRRYVCGYLDPSVQNELVPAAGGQPATAAAWASAEVDRAAGGYFSSTTASVDSAWIRPRYPGWVAVQSEVSEIVRSTITGGTDAERAVSRVNKLYVAEEVRR
jgi:multiple sugar transport system substrate-binding protein